jgi:hypothetical protein
MTEGAFFGQVVNKQNLRRLMYTIVTQFEESFRRPRRVVRRKGYRDKGSLANDSVRAIRQEESVDIFLSLLHFQIEERRRIRSQETDLFREYITEGRDLSNELLIKFRILETKKENDNGREKEKVGNSD